MSNDVIDIVLDIKNIETKKENNDNNEKNNFNDMSNIKIENKSYHRDEIFKDVVEYFNGDEMAANVWLNKYALKDSHGNYYERTPDDMHHRLAREIHRIEKKYPNPLSEEEIYQVLKDFKYIIPQGGPMNGIGNNFQITSLSNCFVIGNEYDSYGSIMLTDQEQIQLMKRRGGVGHDLSHLRPKGAVVRNSALTSTGLVSFMERYSNSTREVGQDGRRGALMLSCSIKHPEAESFINAKVDTTKVTGANISVRVTDEFMKCVIEDKEFEQQYPIDSKNPIIKQKVKARDLFKKIVHNAWMSAEPGVLFWDTIINESVADCYSDYGFKTTSTNPCGEIPLCPYDSCRLLAINLYSYVINPFTDKAYFDFDLFKKHVFMAQKIMDDIVDIEIERIDMIIDKINSDPEPPYIKNVELELWNKIKNMCITGRRIGIGITGMGDMLAALGLTYGTQEATEFATNVHKTLAINAYKSSCLLAKERGSFPIFNESLEKNNIFIKRLSESDEELAELLKQGRRNISLLTVAPTGSVSIMTQTTSGIEPVFMISYKRKRKVNPNDKNARVDEIDSVGDSWEYYNVFHHKFIEWLKVNKYNVDEVISMSDDKLEEIIKKSPYYKATSKDVDWIEKVKMQGSIQKWVDHSISVTVNLPENISEELVQEIYLMAWKSGCKGMTIYREGSRSGVLVSKNDKNKESSNNVSDNNQPFETHAPKRPKLLECDVFRFQNNKEKWIAFVGLLNGRPYEIFTGLYDSFQVPSFVTKGYIKKLKEIKKDENGVDVKISRYDFIYYDKDGIEQEMKALSRAFNREYWNYAKLISGILRHGMPLKNVINLIESLNFDNDNITSWKNGVKRILKLYIKDGEEVKNKTCPMCAMESLKFESGCITCSNCGYSKCD